MARRGTPFSGLLYAGLALTERGVRVVEFNARFGDPETQPLLALLDVAARACCCTAAAEGRLDEVGPLKWRAGAAVAVVVAAEDYPETPRTGDAIAGVAEAEALDGRRRHPRRHRDPRRRRWSPRAAGSSPSPPSAPTSPTPAAGPTPGVDRIRIDGAHHRTDIAAGV